MHVFNLFTFLTFQGTDMSIKNPTHTSNHFNINTCVKRLAIPLCCSLCIAFHSATLAAQTESDDERAERIAQYKADITAMSEACVKKAKARFAKRKDTFQRIAFIEKCRAKHLAKAK